MEWVSAPTRSEFELSEMELLRIIDVLKWNWYSPPILDHGGEKW
jgi:hypothetical protein